jgi:hypothetical protein
MPTVWQERVLCPGLPYEGGEEAGKAGSTDKTRIAIAKAKKAKAAQPREEPDSYDEGGDELSSFLSENSGKE